MKTWNTLSRSDEFDSGPLKNMDNKAEDEAINILQNGILVETNKGLVCMSLNDAISSNLNLSVEDLQDLATRLILQQETNTKHIDNSKNPSSSYLGNSNIPFMDSEGYTSECSDASSAVNNSMQPTFLSLKTLPNNEVNTLNVQNKNLSFASSALSLSNNPVRLNTDSVGETNVSDSDTSVATSMSNSLPHGLKNTDTSDQKTSISDFESSQITKLPTKRRGGWPKGRKRKPELLHLPPKAPATGYTLYLNEQRKLFKGTNLVFHEITKIIGNKWSSLSLAEKQPYLDRAEEEKKRYREEFKIYRQSGAYQMYLTKKRRKRAQYSALSESDMDATDEIDEEDNEELYCRTCDQGFHNLHNKREHLQGRQHQQMVAGDMERELGSNYDKNYLDSMSLLSFNSSLDDTSQYAATSKETNTISNTIADLITNIKSAVSKRESEYKNLQLNLEEVRSKHIALYHQLCALKDRQKKLANDLALLKEKEKEMEGKVVLLWQVPSWFVTTNLKAEENVQVPSVT